MRTLLTFLAALTITSAAASPASADPVPPAQERSARVRAAEQRTAVLLTVGLDRSDTIRTLVNKLEKRDVIVYIEMQPMLKKRVAGMLTWIGATVEHRYVRISINPELSTDMAVSTLGHELQHALEIANASEVVSERTMENFYREHGESTRAQGSGWDTPAARLAGDDVRRELGSARAGRATDSIQQFDPRDWLVVYRRARSMLPP
jgi:hypothetical protein